MTKVSRIRIGTRLVVAFSVIILLFTSAGILALIQLGGLSTSMDNALREAGYVSLTKDLAGLVDDINL